MNNNHFYSKVRLNLKVVGILFIVLWILYSIRLIPWIIIILIFGAIYFFIKRRAVRRSLVNVMDVLAFDDMNLDTYSEEDVSVPVNYALSRAGVSSINFLLSLSYLALNKLVILTDRRDNSLVNLYINSPKEILFRRVVDKKFVNLSDVTLSVKIKHVNAFRSSRDNVYSDWDSSR